MRRITEQLHKKLDVRLIISHPAKGMPMAPRSLTVAEYLTRALDLAGIRQDELSTALGYTRPNVISMMKGGATKVPISKIPAMAKVLGVDPSVMLRLAMREYMPETWDALEGTFGQVMSEKELEWLELYRSADPNQVAVLDTRLKVAVTDMVKAALPSDPKPLPLGRPRKGMK